MLINCGRTRKHERGRVVERGSVDAVFLLSGVLVGLIAWHVYQQSMLISDQERFDAFMPRNPMGGVQFDEVVWPLPLPARTDYGAQSNRLYSIAECEVRRWLQAVSEEGLPRCP